MTRSLCLRCNKSCNRPPYCAGCRKLIGRRGANKQVVVSRDELTERIAYERGRCVGEGDVLPVPRCQWCGKEPSASGKVNGQWDCTLCVISGHRAGRYRVKTPKDLRKRVAIESRHSEDRIPTRGPSAQIAPRTPPGGVKSKSKGGPPRIMEAFRRANG